MTYIYGIMPPGKRCLGPNADTKQTTGDYVIWCSKRGMRDVPLEGIRREMQVRGSNLCCLDQILKIDIPWYTINTVCYLIVIYGSGASAST